MKITLCGSMSCAKKMMAVKERLEKAGHKIFAPENILEYVKGEIEIENKREKIMLDAIRTYYEKIKKSDAILVVNFTKNKIKNYIGGNSLIEMAFAHVLRKKIYLFNPIPRMSYTDEIEAMKPIVVGRSLKKFII
ncbi:MAG: Maf-like protein [Candidatus Berkelbacteria bacterium Licking1014_7]|uniref:Maf-like protein n=1 Tax=Candidatus Berkelbacteria bacterium Licking1014_7 TaxID=2017147 RepID=A0A554LID7_9BACT|nr:MAG: Maf-like protein [Candidatus Berkelbacteria bacterium Licking1014_7]